MYIYIYIYMYMLGVYIYIYREREREIYTHTHLQESLIDVVSDFGSLSRATEGIYINAILRQELPLIITIMIV